MWGRPLFPPTVTCQQSRKGLTPFALDLIRSVATVKTTHTCVSYVIALQASMLSAWQARFWGFRVWRPNPHPYYREQGALHAKLMASSTVYI